jgi:hypothetical protein
VLLSSLTIQTNRRVLPATTLNGRVAPTPAVRNTHRDRLSWVGSGPWPHATGPLEQIRSRYTTQQPLSSTYSTEAAAGGILIKYAAAGR